MAFIRSGERRLKTLRMELQMAMGSKKPLRMRVSVKYCSAFISIAFVQRGKGIVNTKKRADAECNVDQSAQCPN